MSDEMESRLAPLMRAAQDGDAASYQALLRGCIPVITAIARQHRLPPDQVDDVVQDTLMTLHRARATYDPSLRFLPWLRSIAQHRTIDLQRRRGRQGSREVHDPAAYEAHADLAADATERIDGKERGRALRAEVSKLPAGQRQAVERLALGGQNLDQAAAETGRKKVALKVNLHRAIQALRIRMTQPGPDDV